MTIPVDDIKHDAWKRLLEGATQRELITIIELACERLDLTADQCFELFTEAANRIAGEL